LPTSPLAFMDTLLSTPRTPTAVPSSHLIYTRADPTPQSTSTSTSPFHDGNQPLPTAYLCQTSNPMKHHPTQDQSPATPWLSRPLAQKCHGSKKTQPP
jgi:hypothetical protein